MAVTGTRYELPGGVVTVEAATLADALPFLVLERTVISEGRWFVRQPEEFTNSLADVSSMLGNVAQSANSIVLVARRDRSVVGHLSLIGGLRERQRHSAKLEIMVSKAARGAGVGDALLRTGVAWAVANDMVTRIALAVFADNERAIALYRRHGFVEEGRRIGEYVERDGTIRDDVLMWRPATGE